MPRFPTALYGLACAMLAGVVTAQACATPHEAALFNVAGLKSELMVTAISCNDDAEYNSFVTRFRAVLLADDQGLTSYFVHTYGRAGQAQHDAYITNIANQMSQVGVAEGTEFCHRHLVLFAEVLALGSPAQLEAFAASRGYVEPVAPAPCTVTASDPPPVLQKQR